MTTNSTTVASITKSEAPSEVIAQIVGNLEDALVGVAPGHAIIALLCLCILIQKSDITVEDLQTVLRDTSNYLCLSLDEASSEDYGTIAGEDIPTRLLN